MIVSIYLLRWPSESRTRPFKSFGHEWAIASRVGESKSYTPLKHLSMQMASTFLTNKTIDPQEWVLKVKEFRDSLGVTTQPETHLPFSEPPGPQLPNWTTQVTSRNATISTSGSWMKMRMVFVFAPPTKTSKNTWNFPKDSHHTVDGQNPAPVDMVNIPLFIGF